MSRAVATFEGVSKRFGERVLMERLSLRLEPGERLLVLGVSGIGKTTLLRLLAGLDTPDAGRIALSGRVGMVFQEDRLVPHLSVLANAALVGCTADARNLLEGFGMGAFLHAFPGEISGGQRRRVALARALAVRPELLLLDEPFTGLDAAARADVRHALNQRVEALGCAVAMTAHDAENAALPATRTLALPFVHEP